MYRVVIIGHVRQVLTRSLSRVYDACTGIIILLDQPAMAPVSIHTTFGTPGAVTLHAPTSVGGSPFILHSLHFITKMSTINRP